MKEPDAIIRAIRQLRLYIRKPPSLTHLHIRLTRTYPHLPDQHILQRDRIRTPELDRVWTARRRCPNSDRPTTIPCPDRRISDLSPRTGNKYLFPGITPTPKII